jgi:hypothetical protein
MHFISSFFTNFRAEKEKLIINFSAKDKKLTAEQLKIEQQIEQLNAVINNKLVTLRALESSLQNDRISLMTAEIHALRYEIQKIQFEIVQIKEEIGVLTEAAEDLKEQ